MEIEIWRFDVVLKLEFEVKKLLDVHQTVAHQPGLPFRGRSIVLWCSKTFFSFNPSLNLNVKRKISLKFKCTPAID